MEAIALASIMDDLGPPFSETELEVFQQQIGHQLPDDYRQFVQICNGGYVDQFKHGMLVFNGTSAEASCNVSNIYGIREDAGGNLSLLGVYWALKDRIPDQLLVIADDPFGSFVCLGLVGMCRGRVFFFDCEEEYVDDEWDGQVESLDYIGQMADTFTEFLQGLMTVSLVR